MDSGWIVSIIIILGVGVGAFFYNLGHKGERSKLMFYYQEHLDKHEDDMVMKSSCPFCESDKEHSELVSARKALVRDNAEKRIGEERIISPEEYK